MLLIAICAGCGRAPTSTVDYAAQREQMVKEQIVARGITDERVIDAMRKVPRERFVPEESRAASYTDQPLSIGYGQTISQPYVVGLMTQELKLQPTDYVLEIGTGSGYQAAILSELAADVYTIEIVQPLGQTAQINLESLGCENVHVRIGDGYKGWPDKAPFDAIIVTCAPEHVPEPLISQLKEGGRMVIPVGPPMAQELYLVRKQNGHLQQAAIIDVRFVPMTRESR